MRLFLSLARARRGTVGLDGSRRGLGVGVVGDICRVRQRSLAHAAERLTGGRALLVLAAVRGGVEREEEQQVGAENADTGNSGKFLASALAHVREPGPVGRGEVGPRGEVDEAEVDDELEDLEAGDPLLPPDADAARALEVVPVHDHVDGQVEGDGHPGDRGRPDQLGVTEEGGGAMVVAVEEGWCVLASAIHGARSQVWRL